MAIIDYLEVMCILLVLHPIIALLIHTHMDSLRTRVWIQIIITIVTIIMLLVCTETLTGFIIIITVMMAPITEPFEDMD